MHTPCLGGWIEPGIDRAVKSPRRGKRLSQVWDGEQAGGTGQVNQRFCSGKYDLNRPRRRYSSFSVQRDMPRLNQRDTDRVMSAVVAGIVPYLEQRSVPLLLLSPEEREHPELFRAPWSRLVAAILYAQRLTALRALTSAGSYPSCRVGLHGNESYCWATATGVEAIMMILILGG
jgi:hypothetical protein